jgi:hypothetical protein
MEILTALTIQTPQFSSIIINTYFNEQALDC